MSSWSWDLPMVASMDFQRDWLFGRETPPAASEVRQPIFWCHGLCPPMEAA